MRLLAPARGRCQAFAFRVLSRRREPVRPWALSKRINRGAGRPYVHRRVSRSLPLPQRGKRPSFHRRADGIRQGKLHRFFSRGCFGYVRWVVQLEQSALRPSLLQFGCNLDWDRHAAVHVSQRPDHDALEPALPR